MNMIKNNQLSQPGRRSFSNIRDGRISHPDPMDLSECCSQRDAELQSADRNETLDHQHV